MPLALQELLAWGLQVSQDQRGLLAQYLPLQVLMEPQGLQGPQALQALRVLQV